MFLCALRLPSFPPGVVPSRASANQTWPEQRLAAQWTRTAAVFAAYHAGSEVTPATTLAELQQNSFFFRAEHSLQSMSVGNLGEVTDSIGDVVT